VTNDKYQYLSFSKATGPLTSSLPVRKACGGASGAVWLATMPKSQAFPRIRRVGPGAVAAGLLVILLAAARLIDWPLRELREQGYDLLVAAVERPAADGVVVVDIDRPSLAAFGPWPWPRERMASLTEELAGARPGALAFDIVFAGNDRLSAAAVRRDFAGLMGAAALDALAADLPDGDRAFARALAESPSVLGFLLDPLGIRNGPPGPPVLASQRVDLPRIAVAAGGEFPLPLLADSAASIAAISIGRIEDGEIVRRVPLLVAAGRAIYGGLAFEAVRVAAGSPPIALDGVRQEVAVGRLHVPLHTDGALRLHPSGAKRQALRTLSAADLLGGGTAPERLQGKVVLIGGSAPSVAVYRQTARTAFTPSVQVQADAVEQLLQGWIPRPPAAAPLVEALAIAALGLGAVVLALRTAPAAGAAGAIGLLVLWGGLCLLVYRQTQILLDPLTPSAAAGGAFVLAAFRRLSQERAQRAALRRRFEQHLAPAVVRRLAEAPELLRLEGESREVTAFFTDVEGFTALTERADPKVLIATLDSYFDELCGIVIDHGGTIDKIVGDAVHAFFNAPLDLPDHPARAVDCGLAVQAFSRRFRRSSQAAAIGFGRTRVGIDTGMAVVGDIGGGRRLDYTAHGSVMNTAARLEAANKLLGSAVCVSESTAARCPAHAFRSLGKLPLPDRGVVLRVFEPWDPLVPDSYRAAYAAAAALAEEDGHAAAARMAALRREHPDDPVLGAWLRRLPAPR